MAEVAEPPADAQVDAPPPAPPPTGELHITADGIDRGPKQDPPKPGSAKDRLFADLRKRAKPSAMSSSQPTTENAPAAPASPAGQPSPKNAGAAGGNDPATPAVGDPAAAPATAKEEKAEKNPWRVVDKWKARATELEGELAKIKTSPVGEAAKQEFQGKIDSLQKRNEDLENEIRFVNYEKSTEFQTKYSEPYKKAWSRAAKEISEIPVRDASGEERAATINDLAEIVNMPLGRARAAAEQVFGGFADDIMGFRKEILGLLDVQNQALDDAKKTGIQRDKDREDSMRRNGETLQKHITETWSKANEEFTKDPKVGSYFTPREGDEDGNTRLSKGFDLVDRAYNSPNINDPKLSPEERANIVRLHAAVRNRAASWGRLRFELETTQARTKELEKELAKYKATVPGPSGAPAAAASQTAHTSVKDSIFADLRRRAKQI